MGSKTATTAGSMSKSEQSMAWTSVLGTTYLIKLTISMKKLSKDRDTAISKTLKTMTTTTPEQSPTAPTRTANSTLPHTGRTTQ